MFKVMIREIPEEEKAKAREDVLVALDDAAFMVASYMKLMETDEEKKQRFSDLIEETYLNALGKYNNMTPEQMFIKIEMDLLQMTMERMNEDE